MNVDSTFWLWKNNWSSRRKNNKYKPPSNMSDEFVIVKWLWKIMGQTGLPKTEPSV